MTDVVQILTTVETSEQAESLARQLVESRLAACVQISGPIQSLYHWQGKVCESSEYRCTIKSARHLVDQLKSTIANLHPYDTPEILVVAVLDCSDSYQAWIRSELN